MWGFKAGLFEINIRQKDLMAMVLIKASKGKSEHCLINMRAHTIF
jgi:hypothetical protein